MIRITNTWSILTDLTLRINKFNWIQHCAARFTLITSCRCITGFVWAYSFHKTID
uniref:SYM n=1 Tax=Arundo donax TaxID=35708 RepID=A0A0A9CT47_ARUDO